MTIQLLFFGITSDLVGKHSFELEIEKNYTVIQLKDTLTSTYPGLKNINDFAIAVNEEYAEDTTFIEANDVVAIIPPVSGG